MSFKTARRFDKGLDSSNLKALEEHIEHQNKSPVTPEISSRRHVSIPASTIATATIGRYSTDSRDFDPLADTQSKADSTIIHLLVDMSLPWGAGLTADARVKTVSSRGQFDGLGVKAGDRVVGVGSTVISTLAQLKVTIQSQQEKVLIAIKKIERNEAAAITPTESAAQTFSHLNANEREVTKAAMKHVTNGNIELAVPLFQRATELAPDKVCH